MGYLIGRRARSGIERDALGAFAAGIFVGLFADLAFAKAGDRCRDSVSDPVIDAGAAAAFGIDHQKDEALGAVRYVAPRQLRRDVLADAIWIVRHVGRAVGNLLRHDFAIGKG